MSAWEPMGDKIIDKERIFASDPVLREQCTTGLTWTVIPHGIGSMFPLLASIVQKALNVEHHIGEGESWSQVLFQLATTAGAHTITKNHQAMVD